MKWHSRKNKRNYLNNMGIDWTKQLQIPVRESTKSQYKHLAVKSLLTLAIKLKYKGKLNYQKIYPEFDLGGAIPDIWHENWKTKVCHAYEIQKEVNEKWLEEKTKFYSKYENYGFKSVDWILIKLKECPEDLEDCWDWVFKQVI